MFISKMPDGSPEIYNAVQGEGPNTGMPCVFVRLGFCNLACSWCDTPYCWKFKKTGPEREKVILDMTIHEAANAIRKAAPHNRNVVFTGGEPFMQQENIRAVIDELKSDQGEWHFEVETNGTIKLTSNLASRLSCINVSPKLSSSGNVKKLRDVPDAINSFLSDVRTVKHTIFKFVITEEKEKADLREVKTWQEKYKVSNNKIYLMPEGVKAKEIIEGSKRMNEIAMGTGYRVSYRLQAILYGKKRAV